MTDFVLQESFRRLFPSVRSAKVWPHLITYFACLCNFQLAHETAASSKLQMHIHLPMLLDIGHMIWLVKSACSICTALKIHIPSLKAHFLATLTFLRQQQTGPTLHEDNAPVTATCAGSRYMHVTLPACALLKMLSPSALKPALEMLRTASLLVSNSSVSLPSALSCPSLTCIYIYTCTHTCKQHWPDFADHACPSCR